MEDCLRDASLDALAMVRAVLFDDEPAGLAVLQADDDPARLRDLVGAPAAYWASLIDWSCEDEDAMEAMLAGLRADALGLDPKAAIDERLGR